MGNLGNVPLASARGRCIGAAGQGNAELRNAFLLSTVLFVALWIPGGDPTSTKYVECFKGGHGSCPQECRKGGQGLIVGGATPLFAKNYYTMMFSLISLPGQFTIATPPPFQKSWIRPRRSRGGGGQGNAELIIKECIQVEGIVLFVALGARIVMILFGYIL